MIVKGKLDKIIYNKYPFSILSVDKMKVKVSIPHNIIFEEGMFLEIEGNIEEHEKYGRSIVAKTIMEIDEIKQYNLVLSKFISGIGESKEHEIIQFFGDNYIEILKENPLRIYEMFISSKNKPLFTQWDKNKLKLSTLTENEIVNYISNNFKGITKNKAKDWVDSIKNNGTNDIKSDILYKENVMSYLSTPTGHKIYNQIKDIDKILDIYTKLEDLGYSDFIVNKIVDNFKFESLDRIYHNPYIPIEYKMSFEDCDSIALNKINFDRESIHRITYGLLEVLKRNSLQGSTYLFKEDAVSKASILLDIDDVDYVNSILEMNLSYGEQSSFILYNDKLYLPGLFFAEKKIAKELFNKINDVKNDVSKESLNIINNSFLSENQKEAVIGLLENKISILTGGPGTGKTTCVKILCEALKVDNKSFALASPTGRASKRLTESTGYNAKTIHRLLEYTGRGKYSFFKRNENFKLDENYIIIDESSMLDIYIMNNLLKAVSSKTSIIFIGDIDQLPSVGTGSILKDMKESLVIPVFTLDTVYRQGKESYIIKNSNNIKNNRELELEANTDFSFKEIESESEAYEFIRRCINAKKEFQILCPVKNGSLGTHRLNEIMQSALNPSSPCKKELFVNGKLFRIGDRVIQLENNYDKDVFNGEMGIIESINDYSITVNYKDNTTTKITYNPKEFKQLDLSYAISIHKSQGSEFNNVIMVADTNNKGFLSKELIYTGITRAKKGLAFLSTLDKDFYTTLKESNNRATSIEDFLKQLVFN